MKFYNALPKKTPSETYKGTLQATIDANWNNTTRLFTIGRESTVGYQTYTDLEVQIGQTIDPSTGQKMGDDYRNITFKNSDVLPLDLGNRFWFVDNVWMTMNTNNHLSDSYSVKVVRCNNVIKWKLDDGTIHIEPIIIKNNLNGSAFDSQDYQNTIKGSIEICLQYNDFTKDIEIDDRYILGNGESKQAYKISSLNTFISQDTFNNDTKLIYATAQLVVLNLDTDDINDMIGYDVNVYTLNINQIDFEQTIGYTTTLDTTVKLNNETIDYTDITWSTSDEEIVSISDSGVCELLTIGSATIYAQLGDNSNIVDSITIDVKTLLIDEYVVKITPNVTEILQGETQIYEVYLYNNNIQKGNLFTFVDSGVLSEYYNFNIIDDNSFSVENIKQYNDNDLTISCTSGIYSENINISLKGMW